MALKNDATAIAGYYGSLLFLASGTALAVFGNEYAWGHVEDFGGRSAFNAFGGWVKPGLSVYAIELAPAWVGALYLYLARNRILMTSLFCIFSLYWAIVCYLQLVHGEFRVGYRDQGGLAATQVFYDDMCLLGMAVLLFAASAMATAVLRRMVHRAPIQWRKVVFGLLVLPLLLFSLVLFAIA